MRTFSLFRLLVTGTAAAGLLLSAAVAHAQTIRRCNNSGVTGANIFTTIQAAHNAAVAGDIIYLEPSSISYGELEATKPLTIIGPGYFLGEQTAPLQADNRTASMDFVLLRNGAAGTRITGCTFNSELMVNANNCNIERNRILGSLNLGADQFRTGAGVTMTQGIFRQNFIQGNVQFRFGATSISSILVSNNIVLNDISGGNTSALNGALISNNVIGQRDGSNGGGIDVDNCLLKNNIVTRAAAAFALRSNASNNNIGTGTQFGTTNGNQQNVALSSVFLTGATGTDGQFRVAAPGPATGTGESGADCGAFGGTAPYVQAGIPNVPTIFQYSQSISGTTLNATISTRSNK